MNRRTILLSTVWAAAVCALPGAAFAAERLPLLMEGKKTLYQRVLSRPGAVLKRDPGDGTGTPQPALTRFYVYGRKAVNGEEWLEVGLTTKGKVDGWLGSGFTLPWKQQMALAFTNPAGRERALLFKEKKDLMAMVEQDQPAAALTALRSAVGGGQGDPRVVSIEPENYIDITKQFYLLPILDAEEAFSAAGHRMRVLQIASITAQGEPEPEKKEPEKANLLRNFNASVVFVVDATVSMGPYIKRIREAVHGIYGRIDKAGLLNQVKFGMVAFRSNVQATPGIEYTSKMYADPSQVKDGADFLAKVADLKEATVSSARFSEDSYAGVMTALETIPWTQFGGRYVVLITDAGALRGNDPLSSTKLDAEQVRLEALHRGVAIYTLHLKTPEGKKNHAEAEAQYTVLSSHPLLSAPLYYPVDAGSVERFGQMVDRLGDAIVEQVGAAYRGEKVAGSAAGVDEAVASPTKDLAKEQGKEQAKEQDRRLREDAALLGHAMQLAYLGRVEGTRPPPLFSAWIADRDLVKPEVATTEVRVLLTKNQLSDMRQVLRSISEAGQAAQLSPASFFAKLQSAAAVLSRDPNAVTSPNAVKLADLGLMGEYLDGLPYRSKVLDIDQQTWSSWSIGQQQAFLDEIERKLRLYQLYHDDTGRWVALDNGADPGETVYPVPLDALP